MATQRDQKSDLSPRKVAEQLKEEGKERLERGKAGAADQVDHVANALRNAGDELGGQSTLGNYANQFAGSIGRLGQRLRDSSVEELAGDLQATARRNPTMFLMGGVALGFVLARLVKASSTPDESNSDDQYDFAGDGPSDASNEWSDEAASSSTARIESSNLSKSGSSPADMPSSQQRGE